MLDSYLVTHTIELLVLAFYHVSHVLGHIFQVTQVGSNHDQVFLHLVFAGVVGDALDVGSKEGNQPSIQRIDRASEAHLPGVGVRLGGPLGPTVRLLGHRVRLFVPPDGVGVANLLGSANRYLTDRSMAIRGQKPHKNANLFQGQTHRPHHFSMPVMCLLAWLSSAFMTSMPFSMLFNCSEKDEECLDSGWVVLQGRRISYLPGGRASPRFFLRLLGSKTKRTRRVEWSTGHHKKRKVKNGLWPSPSPSPSYPEHRSKAFSTSGRFRMGKEIKWKEDRKKRKETIDVNLWWRWN